MKAISCHRNMADQALTRTSGSIINATTMPRIPRCALEHRGGHDTEHELDAVRMIAMVAINPAKVTHPCMNFDPFMVPHALPRGRSPHLKDKNLWRESALPQDVGVLSAVR
jgi:hypothetical protein